MELMAKAKALEATGFSVIHLEVGEPDFPTAEPILAAAQSFLRQGHVHYTAALGLPALREKISDFYAQTHGIEVSPERIIITAGASGALLIALGVLVSPGSEWLLPDPGYPCNRNFVSLFEGIPQGLPVGSEANFQPTPEEVAARWNHNTGGLMVASPANPTGSVLSRQQLTALWNVVRARGGSFIVDEIYHGLTYGAKAESALGISEDIFVINSFSKYFGMTGWRLGWLVAPPTSAREIEKLAQNLFICPSAVAQHAALEAFNPETIGILEQRRQLFQKRRNTLLTGLRKLDFSIAKAPEGAFYIYANSSAHDTDSFKLAHQLLTKAGVAATPGLDFGNHRPADHIRFAYTLDEVQIEMALERLQRYFDY